MNQQPVGQLVTADGAADLEVCATERLEVEASQHASIVYDCDPVEVVHTSKKANIFQREIGAHTDSFEVGFERGLRAGGCGSTITTSPRSSAPSMRSQAPRSAVRSPT